MELDETAKMAIATHEAQTEFYRDQLEDCRNKNFRLEQMYWEFRAALQRIEEFETDAGRYGLVRALASDTMRKNILGEGKHIFEDGE